VPPLVVFAFLLTSLCVGAAFAQIPPYVHGGTVGTSPIQAAPNDLLRRKIVLYNPNATAIIAYCPAGPSRDTGLPLVCAVNGAGSITLQPYTGFVLQGSNGATRLDMPSAINVISSTPGWSYTVWDQE